MDDIGTKDEELFSMEDLEKDLKRGRGGRRLTWFLGGLVLGIAGTIAVPRFLGPYLPDVLTGEREVLSGPVLAEERDGERLLLTIDAEPGALIASFTQRVAEIAQLVDPGDVVTIAVPDYEPFVEDPDFEGVKKGAGRPSIEESGIEGDAMEESGIEGDAAEGEVLEGDAPAGVGEPDTTAAEPAPPDTASEGAGR